MTSMLPKTEIITLCSYYSTSLRHLILWTTLFSFTFSILLLFITKLYPGSPLISTTVLSVSLLLTPPLSMSLWGYSLGPFLFTHTLLVTNHISWV
ncbi:hypothetical protein FKM82_028265 [Ascaphus truei]